MKLTVLGCSGSVPGPGVACSGYLIEVEGFRLVVELGHGTLAVLQEFISPFDIDALALSHLHADHCADFSALTIFRKWCDSAPYDTRVHKLPVYAPADAEWRFAAADATNPDELANKDLSDVYEFNWLNTATWTIGPFTVTTAPVKHLCETFGFRIEHAGRTLTYTGDTGPCPELDRLAQGADLLLANATWPEAQYSNLDFHLTGIQAGKLAANARAGRMLLSHIRAWDDKQAVMTEARRGFCGPIEFAEQGKSYEV